MATKKVSYEVPIVHEMPPQMICRMCGRCSTALDTNRVCWRHDEYKGLSYLGKLENTHARELPEPAYNGSGE